MNNKKRAAILTFCTWGSYGSILQAYSLQRFLKSISIESKLLLEKKQSAYLLPDYVTRKQNVLKKALLYFINVLFEKRRKKRFVKNSSFINDNLDKVYFENYEYLEKNKQNLDYEFYISGSDQVFHPSVCNPAFFLDFVPDSFLKISYAASLGSLTVPKENEATFSNYLNNFDIISLRENDAVPVVSHYFKKPIYTNCDPTFLISSNEWNELIKPYKIKRKFYLVYAIYWDKTLNSKLKELKEKSGFDIVTISDGFTNVYHDKIVCDAGIDEFLWLIKKSEGIITSSFHGACLSMIFNKPLSVINNPDRPSRLSCLLQTFEFPTVSIESLNSFSFDYSLVNKKIALLKANSINFFKKVLSYEK